MRVNFSTLLLLLVFSAAVFFYSKKIFTVFSYENITSLFDYKINAQKASDVGSRFKEPGYVFKISVGGYSISILKENTEFSKLASLEVTLLPDAIRSYGKTLDSQSSYGLTEQDLDLLVNRAKERLIARTIMQYGNVKRADVTIENARDVLFVEDKEESSVDVIITMEDALETMAEPQGDIVKSCVLAQS